MADLDIAAIRQRDTELTAALKIYYGADFLDELIWAHEDRGPLLSEVERLMVENEALRKVALEARCLISQVPLDPLTVPLDLAVAAFEEKLS